MLWAALWAWQWAWLQGGARMRCRRAGGRPPAPPEEHPWGTRERTQPSLPGQCPSQTQKKDLLRPLFCGWSPPGSSAPGGARPGPKLANGSCLLLKQSSIMQIDREMFKASCPVSMNYGLAGPGSRAPGSFWGSGCSESSPVLPRAAPSFQLTAHTDWPPHTHALWTQLCKYKQAHLHIGKHMSTYMHVHTKT